MGVGGPATSTGELTRWRTGFGYEQPAGRDLIDARIHYLRGGRTGPRVLLIHPIGFDCHTWDAVVPALESRCRWVAIDIPGHGESDCPPGADYRLPSIAMRVLRLMDEMGWPDAVFVGNSIGGGIALAAAEIAPARVRGLALLNTVAFRDGLPAMARLAFPSFIEKCAGLSPPWAVAGGLRYARAGRSRAGGGRVDRCTAYLRNPAGREAFFRTLRQLYGPTIDRLAQRYAGIRCPTLIAHGVQDPLILVRHARRLAAVIPGAALHEIPHCGHFPQEECPETTTGLLRSFLAQYD